VAIKRGEISFVDLNPVKGKETGGGVVKMIND